MSIPATQKCSIVIFVGLVLVYRLLLRYLQSVVKTSPNDDITYELFLYFSSGIVVMNVFWDSYRGVFVVLCLAVINAFWSLVSFVYFLITNFVPRIQPYVPNNVSLIPSGHQLMQELAMTESVEAMDAVFALFRCSVFFVVIAWMLMCFAISWLCESRADDEEKVEEVKRVTTTRHRGSTLDEAARRLTMPLLPHGLPHFTKPSGRSTTEPHGENRHSLLSTAPSMTQSTEIAPAKRIAAPPPAPPLPTNVEKSKEEKENV